MWRLCSTLPMFGPGFAVDEAGNRIGQRDHGDHTKIFLMIVFKKQAPSAIMRGWW